MELAELHDFAAELLDWPELQLTPRTAQRAVASATRVAAGVGWSPAENSIWTLIPAILTLVVIYGAIAVKIGRRRAAAVAASRDRSPGAIITPQAVPRPPPAAGPGPAVPARAAPPATVPPAAAATIEPGGGWPVTTLAERLELP